MDTLRQFGIAIVLVPLLTAATPVERTAPAARPVATTMLANPAIDMDAYVRARVEGRR